MRAVGAVAVLLVLAACSSDPGSTESGSTASTPTSATTVVPSTQTSTVPFLTSYVGAPDGPRIAFVGDSITHLAAPSIRAAFEPGYRINLQAQIGLTIEEMLPALRAQLTGAGGRPDAVVVNLGTNDVLRARGDRLRASFDELIAMVIGLPCVVLTTISDASDVGRPPLAGEINAAIADVAARPNVHTVDWAAEATGPGSATYTTDGFHPSTSSDPSDTSTGTYRIAELDLQAVRDRCGLR